MGSLRRGGANGEKKGGGVREGPSRRGGQNFACKSIVSFGVSVKFTWKMPCDYNI